MEHYYIYCLHNDDLPEYYVGHTVNLYHRWGKHKNQCKTKNYKVYKYIRINGGFDNFKMEILDESYCSLEEATKLERYYAELLGATLNTQVPSRTKKEYSNKYKKSQDKKYRDKNREKLNKKRTERYHNNKDEINEKKKTKITCICGSECAINHRARHWKTQKHINFIRENIGY